MSRASCPRVKAPYALIHTVEGMPEDVATELEEAKAVLRSMAVADSQELELTGSEVWADELGAASPSETRLRAGMAPQDLPGLLSRLESALNQTPIVADIASGLLYVRSSQAEVLRAVRRGTEIPDGYSLAISAPNRPDQIWGHAPQSTRLMEALKAHWNPGGLFNPDAFIV